MADKLEDVVAEASRLNPETAFDKGFAGGRAFEREVAAKAAESVAEFWRGQAKEWESPKYDLEAEFVRHAAKHKADAADECAAAIRKIQSR